ncbi:MAG: cytochrome c3 family protein [Acidobacteria bacterium]|nr:cytochrome c3 family protein [Acidobacteriota bacterium]
MRNVLKIVSLATAIALSILAQTPQTPAPPKQPLPFSHKLHVAQGLKCQGCHVNPDIGPNPGEKMTYPATAKCMACHEDTAADKPAIKALAKFHHSKESVPWVRVYQLPDWVWFSHRVHLEAGAKCDRCHGAVSEREALWKEKPTTMESCMNCHRETNASNACNYCHEGH